MRAHLLTARGGAAQIEELTKKLEEERQKRVEVENQLKLFQESKIS